MFRKKLIKNYKWMMAILIILGVCLITASQLNYEWLNKDYTAGLGFGLIIAAALNIIILRIKQRKADYEDILELELNDERVKMNKLRALAYAGAVAVTLLCIISIVNAYASFDMVIGNIIVLFGYSGSLAFFKWFFRNK